MQSNNQRNDLGKRSRLVSAAVFSLGLAASFMMKITLEVYMSVNIAVSLAICLAVGTGLLGSRASAFPNEKRTN